MTFREGALVVALAVYLSGCGTTPNPRSCADGTCTDPSLPFCDVDGALHGAKDTCVAVDCTPTTFEACRGSIALTCNAAGTDYDLIQCDQGCGPTGCTACSADAQCSNPAPICDGAVHACRACRTDDECASAVCDAGACVVESAIVYASPLGINAGNCTRAAPCTLTRAVSVAATPSNAPTLRLLPGTYTELLSITTPTTIKIVGTGATLAGAGRLDVKAGSVDVRGLTIQSTVSNFEGVTCGAATPTPPLPRLAMHGCSIVSTPPASPLGVVNCQASLDSTDVTGDSIRVDDDGTLVADRVSFVNAPTSGGPGAFTAFGNRLTVRVTNSVVYDLALSFNKMDLATTNDVTFAFDTIVETHTNAQILCSSSAAFAHVGRFEDDIIFSTTADDAVTGTSCTTANNLLFPQAAARAGNVVADPKLVDVAAKNFHLQMTSPARDAALPSAGLSTDHDHDGTMRPQGSAPDLGAFEYKP